MNEIKKPNDIFVATLLNPNISNLDLIQADINPENTGFLSMDDYKESKFVQESFTKDGKFDNIAFEQAYITAAKKYEDFTNEDFYKNLESTIYKSINGGNLLDEPLLNAMNALFGAGGDHQPRGSAANRILWLRQLLGGCHFFLVARSPY